MLKLLGIGIVVVVLGALLGAGGVVHAEPIVKIDGSSTVFSHYRGSGGGFSNSQERCR